MFKKAARYKLVWIAVSVFTAMLLGTFVPQNIYIWVMTGFSVAGITASILVRFREKKLVICCLLAVLLSSAHMFLYTTFVYNPVVKFLDKDVIIEGSAQSMIEKSTNYYTAVIKCKKLTVLDDENSNETYNTNFKLRIYFSVSAQFEASAKVRFNGYIFDDAEPYGSDRSKGLFLTSFSTSYEVIEPANKKSFTYNFANFQQSIKERLGFEKDDVGAYMKGMMLGDKTGLAPEFKDAFTQAGLSHVLAVSGMHLTFAIVFLNGLLTLLGVQYRHSDVISIAAALFFTALVGFPLSCIRAAIMLIVHYSARLFRRDPDSVTSLAAAVLIICIIMPFSVRDVGFLLSASATGGIILLTPSIDRMILPGFYFKKSVMVQSLYRAAKYAFAVALGANIACIPVLVLVFKKISLIGPVCSTILTMPIQLAFNLGIVGLIISFWPWGYHMISEIINVVYIVIEKLIYFFASLKFATVGEGYFFFYLVVIVGLITFGCAMYFNHRYEKFRAGALVCAFTIFCFSLYGYDAIRTRGIIYASFVDVGQGDSAVLMRNSKAVVIDCGGSGDGFYKLRNELGRQNVETIEYVLLTHLHSDHSDYLELLLKYYEVENIVYPGAAETDDEDFEETIQLAEMEGANIITEQKDITLEVLNKAKIHVLTEQADFEKSGNESCYAYILEYGRTKIMYTGDMELETESRLAEYGKEVLDCDILKVAHHGSKTSSSSFILNMITPQVSVISVGENSYGHPNKKVLERLSEYSDKIYRTDLNSTIRFNIDNNSYEREVGFFGW